MCVFFAQTINGVCVYIPVRFHSQYTTHKPETHKTLMAKFARTFVILMCLLLLHTSLQVHGMFTIYIQIFNLTIRVGS